MHCTDPNGTLHRHESRLVCQWKARKVINCIALEGREDSEEASDGVFERPKRRGSEASEPATGGAPLRVPLQLQRRRRCVKWVLPVRCSLLPNTICGSLFFLTISLFVQEMQARATAGANGSLWSTKTTPMQVRVYRCSLLPAFALTGFSLHDDFVCGCALAGMYKQNCDKNNYAASCFNLGRLKRKKGSLRSLLLRVWSCFIPGCHFCCTQWLARESR